MGYLTGTTIFADIEDTVTSYGFLPTSQYYNGNTGETLNRWVWTGFYDAVNGQSIQLPSGPIVTAYTGVYSSPSAWLDAMGDWNALTDIPIWTYENETSSCGCPTTVSAVGFGNGNISIHQYCQNGGDYDVANNGYLPS